MIKILKSLGSLVYGAILYYLLWLFFDWVTPRIMDMRWGELIIYMLVGIWFMTMFFAMAITLLEIPFIFLCRNCKAAKYAPIIFGLLFGIDAVSFPWTLDMKYGVLQWILGIVHTITVLTAFISLMAIPFKNDKEERDKRVQQQASQQQVEQPMMSMMTKEYYMEPNKKINYSGIVKSVIAVAVLIILYLFALNGRYSKVHDDYYFDKWRRCVVEAWSGKRVE